jgi:serine/threonine protein kinase
MCWMCGILMPACALSKMPCGASSKIPPQGSRAKFCTPSTPEGVDCVMHTRGHLAAASESSRLPVVNWRELHVPLGRRKASGYFAPRSGSFATITGGHTFAGRFGVVLKTVNFQTVKCGLATSEHWADLQREAELHATLSHPNIVVCIGTVYENEDGPLSLVLEEGTVCLQAWWDKKETLAGGKRMRVSSSAFPKHSAILRLKFMLQVSQALAYLHRCQVAHGDVHTGNILVCGSREDPVLKLCDFGRSVDFS